MELEFQNPEFKILDCQNPEFTILKGQNPEFAILYGENPEFTILEDQNPEFKMDAATDLVSSQGNITQSSSTFTQRCLTSELDPFSCPLRDPKIISCVLIWVDFCCCAIG